MLNYLQQMTKKIYIFHELLVLNIQNNKPLKKVLLWK